MNRAIRQLSLALVILILAPVTTAAVRANYRSNSSDASTFAGLDRKNESETKNEPQYAPDRKVDILHVALDVTPDFKARTIKAVTTIEFSPIAKPLTELRLDAIDLDVSKVTSTAKIAGYSVTKDAVIITFDPPLEPAAETTVTIDYHAEPKQGLYFRTPDMGYLEQDIHLFTQCQPHRAPHWFPNYDYPNERFTSEVTCCVPEDMTVLSNGRLVSEYTDPNTGLKAVRWLQDKPHVNYLIALAAGKFAKVQAQYKDIPLAFYTPPSQIDQAQNSFKDTADMMQFFQTEIGVDYPWDKYDQVVVDDYISGGMENTTLTILTDYTLFTDETENIYSSQTLVSHELVHQWFGDYVTCKDWSHAWLNEGFATYYALLYDEHKDGRDELLYGLYRYAHGIISNERTAEIPILHRTYESAREQFHWDRIYAKGAWIVHMLRSQLGIPLYQQCIKTYLQRHALSDVVTEDLNSVIEELSGRSFDRFFDQWVFHPGHPVLQVSYNWSQKNRLAKVSVKQTQPPADKVMLFHFPAKVRFILAGQPINHEIRIDTDQHDFYFPLEAEPNIVRFDPEYTLLADVTFDKPKPMLYAQLENQQDLIGRLLAVEALRDKDDKTTVEKLKTALNNDTFYGVRKQASQTLRQIHTDQAFDALADSLQQPDARVRLQVVKDIGRFYRPKSLELTTNILQTEKNPAILAEAIRNLGRYHGNDTNQMLLDYLESKSYRNQLADAAVSAIDKLKDPSLIDPLISILTRREQDFRSGDFAEALETLAVISHDEKDKTEVCDFFAGYVNHKKERIAAGAITALGKLGDPKAIPIIETFSGDNRDDRIQRSAKKALRKLREEKKLVPEEIVRLRETVDEMKKDHDKLKDDLEDVKKRLDAQQKAKKTPKKKRKWKFPFLK